MDFNSLILFGFFAIIAIVIGWFLHAQIIKFQNQKKIKRGIFLEEKAAEFLIKKKYSIISHHEKFEYTLNDNKKNITIHLESDYIVKKAGKLFLVEVKSGENTSNIQYAATRRQLLEYFFVTNYDGYLLVDMNKEEIHEIKFPHKKSIQNNYALTPVFVCIGILWISSIFLPKFYNYYVSIPAGMLLILMSSKISKWFSK